MGRSRTSQVVVLAALLLFAGWVVRGEAMYALMRWTGTPMVTGTSTLTFSGRPGRVLTLLTQPPQEEGRWNSPSAAFHVLVVFPGDSLTERGGSNSSSPISAGYDKVWSVWSGALGHEHAVQRAFTSRYSAFTQTVRMGGQRFSLKDGNLFVVRYDERGRMSVSQLPRTVLDADSYNAMNTIETLLPADAAVQNLQHWGEKRPCPRAPAPMPRGAST